MKLWKAFAFVMSLFIYSSVPGKCRHRWGGHADDILWCAREDDVLCPKTKRLIWIWCMLVYIYRLDVYPLRITALFTQMSSRLLVSWERRKVSSCVMGPMLTIAISADVDRCAIHFWFIIYIFFNMTAIVLDRRQCVIAICHHLPTCHSPSPTPDQSLTSCLKLSSNEKQPHRDSLFQFPANSPQQLRVRCSTYNALIKHVVTHETDIWHGLL